MNKAVIKEIKAMSHQEIDETKIDHEDVERSAIRFQARIQQPGNSYLYIDESNPQSERISVETNPKNTKEEGLQQQNIENTKYAKKIASRSKEAKVATKIKTEEKSGSTIEKCKTEQEKPNLSEEEVQNELSKESLWTSLEISEIREYSKKKETPRVNLSSFKNRFEEQKSTPEEQRSEEATESLEQPKETKQKEQVIKAKRKELFHHPQKNEKGNFLQEDDNQNIVTELKFSPLNKQAFLFLEEEEAQLGSRRLMYPLSPNASMGSTLLKPQFHQNQIIELDDLIIKEESPQNQLSPQTELEGYYSPTIAQSRMRQQTLLWQQRLLDSNALKSQPSLTVPSFELPENSMRRYEMLNETFVDVDKSANKLSYEKVLKHVKKNSPLTESGEYYTCYGACCHVKTGFHCCGVSAERSELEKYGVGIVLYFKFLKYLIFFFIIFSLLSIPALFFSISAYANYNPSSQSSFNAFLQASTVGSIGLGASTCDLGQVPARATDPAQQQVTFSCPNGTLQSASSVFYGYTVNTSETCDLIDYSYVVTSCNLGANSLSKMWAECEGEQSCQITLDDSFFDQSSHSCRVIGSRSIVYIKVYCNVEDVLVKTGTYIPKKYIALILTTCDACMIVIYLLMVVMLKFLLRRSARNVLKSQYSAKLYTVVITHLPEMASDKLYFKLWNFIEERLNTGREGALHKIVDIQLVKSNKILDMQLEVSKLTRKKREKIREFIHLFYPDFDQQHVTYSTVCELFYKTKGKTYRSQTSLLRFFKKIKTLHENKRQLEDKIRSIFGLKNTKVYAAFVTFERADSRDAAIQKLHYTAMERFFDKFFSYFRNRNGEKYFEYKLLNVEQAKDPSSIIWPNVDKSLLEILLRRTFSAFLTVCVLGMTTLIVATASREKTEFNEKYPTIDCRGRNPSIDEVTADYNKGPAQIGLLQCYCDIDRLARFNTYFPDMSDHRLCVTWFFDKTLAFSLTYAIVFGVILINYLLQYLYIPLSEFEKHRTLTTRLGSNVIKVFVGQFINTGVLILFLNAKFNGSSDSNNWFFRGVYTDLTTIWYFNVGVTILYTMFITVFTYPGFKILNIFARLISICWDTKFRCNPRITRTKTQKNYQKIHLRPLFLLEKRYSQILTVVWICFLYNSGLPLLVITTLIQLIFSYFLDKYLLLSASRIPENYDEHMDLVAQDALYYVAFLHVIFAIWIYGNTDIFSNSMSAFSGLTQAMEYIAVNTSKTLQNQWIPTFFRRVSYEQNILLAIFGALIVVFILAYNFIRPVIKCLARRCCKAKFADVNGTDEAETAQTLASSPRPSKKKTSSKKNQNSENYYEILSEKHLKTLLFLNKTQIQEKHNPEYNKIFEDKIERLKAELKNRQTGYDQKYKLIGLPSYDVRLHPTYRGLFELKENSVGSESFVLDSEM